MTFDIAKPIVSSWQSRAVRSVGKQRITTAHRGRPTARDSAFTIGSERSSRDAVTPGDIDKHSEEFSASIVAVQVDLRQSHLPRSEPEQRRRRGSQVVEPSGVDPVELALIAAAPTRVIDNASARCD
jgi:hypothetical protein